MKKHFWTVNSFSIYDQVKHLVEFFQQIGKEVLMEVLRFLQTSEIVPIVLGQKLKEVIIVKGEFLDIRTSKLI